MKIVFLELEHRYKNRFVRKHILRSSNQLRTIGSAVDSDIKLMGHDVSPIHAFIEYENGKWVVGDAGSTQGTWIAKQPIVRADLDAPVELNIGAHVLTLIPREVEQNLFETEKMQPGTGGIGDQKYHQLIVRQNGQVKNTYLLPETQGFEMTLHGKTVRFPPPKNGELKTSHELGYEVFQRIVSADKTKQTVKDHLENLKSPDMRAPLTVILIFVAVIFGLMIWIPLRPKSEILPPELGDNQFTRMIFDAKVIKEKREQAKKYLDKRNKKTELNPAAAGAKEQKTTAVQSKGATPKVVSQLKMTGLSSLISKISKRASTAGVKIYTQGEAPDSEKVTGAASKSAQVGSIDGTVKVAGNTDKTFKVGAIATVGKGGGGTGLSGASGLNASGAGSANVGIVEEETEVEGGLDKDAIAKVIQSNIGEVRYCYERQLSAEPDLFGKIIVKFSIDAGGKVLSPRLGSSSLKSQIVEGCILRRLANWKFPNPKGGTTVNVTYPFLSKSTK